MVFEPYDYRMGCLAVQRDGVWYVVAPNGRVISVHGLKADDARAKAQHLNLTATAQERNSWRR